MLSTLVTLSNLIASSIAELEKACAESKLPFPNLDEPFTPQSEAFRKHPAASEAANVIAAAANQLLSTVLPPPMALGSILSGVSTRYRAFACFGCMLILTSGFSTSNRQLFASVWKQMWPRFCVKEDRRSDISVPQLRMMLMSARESTQKILQQRRTSAARRLVNHTSAFLHSRSDLNSHSTLIKIPGKSPCLPRGPAWRLR